MPQLSASQTYLAKDKAGEKIQKRINDLMEEIEEVHAPSASPLHLVCFDVMLRRHLREQLVSIAEAHLAAFPQYANHFNTCVIGRVGDRVETKLGLAAEKGDIVLGFPPTRTMLNPQPSWAIFSNRSWCVTSIGQLVDFQPL